MTLSLFESLLGETFSQLPVPIKTVHDGRTSVFHGRCEVQRGTRLLSQLAGWLTSLPRGGSEVDVTVEITCDQSRERWRRNFGGKIMQSDLQNQNGLLMEKLGPVTFCFELTSDGSRIDWRVVGARFLFVPLPPSWFKNVKSSEYIKNGKYTFDVDASLPLVGHIVCYRGWLDT